MRLSVGVCVYILMILYLRLRVELLGAVVDQPTQKPRLSCRVNAHLLPLPHKVEHVAACPSSFVPSFPLLYLRVRDEFPDVLNEELPLGIGTCCLKKKVLKDKLTYFECHTFPT